MLRMVELDREVSLMEQMTGHESPVVLANVFRVAPEDADALVAAWSTDAGILKAKPGYVSAQLHRGIAGSSTFLNYAVWESVDAFKSAFTDPAFQATFERYPDSTTASPHLFKRIWVPGISEGK